MISFLSNNLGNILATAVIIAIISTSLTVIIKNKKNGKSSCGCGCSHCAMQKECHKEK